MHAEPIRIEIDEVIKAGPLKLSSFINGLMWGFVAIGLLTFTFRYFSEPAGHFWGAYYVNLLFFMGLACGGAIIPVIFQIVRAQWSPPVRRIAEANVAFLPWAFMLFLVTYAGKEALFPWARAPMPGREWWMQPDFVYTRFAILLAFLFFLMSRFVRMSLRGDVGMVRERTDSLHGWPYDGLISGWRGTEKEVADLQPKMSWNGPLIIFLYATIYSLFSFEMIMGMDTSWISNMFGGFMFVGNIYLGWIVLAFTVMQLGRTNRDYAKVITKHQLWDLGKLCFGFCMLWGYLFFSQFLPQWYGNLPEETQWMILRTRDWNLPWIRWGWVTFPLCFVIPFVLLLSRDVKKTPKIFSIVCAIVFCGIWAEKYIIVMPQLYPTSIPFNLTEVGLFCGFFGAYVLSIRGFLSRYPFVPVSSPLTRGSTKW